ncbi:hypothetical protein Tco_0671558 [Tanacetum coccineum]
MDDPNITMEEYIRLQTEKAQRHGQTFNWKTATYGKVYCEDFSSFIYFEADFLAIVYNDALTSKENDLSEPTMVHVDWKNDGSVEGDLWAVRILQISQENGQNRAKMNTGTDKVHKSREVSSKGQ